jgi:hypothetical protein
MKFIKSLPILFALAGTVTFVASPTVVVADDIDKILKAKEIVKSMVNYPDTLVFHNLYTKVRGNTVTLKFTCENAFGVPETHVMDIKVD